MVAKKRYRAMAAVLVAAVWWRPGIAVGQDVPATPVLVAQESAGPDRVGFDQAPPPSMMPGPPHPTGPFGSGGAPPACAPGEACNGPLLKNDSLLDPDHNAPGWVGDVELVITAPHIKNRLSGPVSVGPFTDTLHLPTADLDGTIAPRFEIGYRLPEGAGEFLLSYRFLVTEGNAVIPDFDVADGALRSRLDLNVVDLDYASREFSLGPQFDMKWHIGARLAHLFFDSQAVGEILEARTSQSFFGAGPHAGLDLAWRSCVFPEYAFFTRLDGAVAIGEINQNFEVTANLPDTGPIGGANRVHATQAVPIVHLQAGFSYAPTWGDNQVRFLLGYDFEQWWYLGPDGPNHSELTLNGFFFRTEFNY